MKINVFFNIAFRIILLFGTAILMTFLPDQLRGFFGDTKFIPHNNGYFLKEEIGAMDVHWNWGTRHYWYFWMCVTLFILAVINFIISIIELVKKEYPNL